MMKQYLAIKKQYQDCLLFYRMGDFYELFLEDAHIGAKVLDITLTSRSKGKDGRVPLAGVPYHAVDSYLTKLIKAGYKVAICEQVSEPNSKGLVDREVVRIVTPGTVLDEKALERKENNYIVSLVIEKSNLGFAAADVSTGQFITQQIHVTDLNQTIRDEFGRLSPVECVLSEESYNSPEILKILKDERTLNITNFSSFSEFTSRAPGVLKNHFGVSTLSGFGLAGMPLAIKASAALIGYLSYTQKEKIGHIKTIKVDDGSSHLMMDRSTIVNLELFNSIRDQQTQGTLITVLDRTQTAMGGRLLRIWMRKPLVDKTAISERYDAVEEFVKNYRLCESIRSALCDISDVERLLSRLSVGIGNARDLVNLKNSLSIIRTIRDMTGTVHSAYIKKAVKGIGKEIEKVILLIDTTILPEPPVSVREGGMILGGVNPELDTLRTIVGGGKDWITALEEGERSKTGINTLKVRFNKVFGFYIEVSRANTHLVPTHYMRKQTLVGGERFITPELKEKEELILAAEEKLQKLEYSLFGDVLEKVLSHTRAIQQACESIAVLDCITSFAFLARKYTYSRPNLLSSGEILIKEGRHPVVEQVLTDAQFVPNDIYLDSTRQQLLLITGPNMAGKSVLLRTVALIVLMAHMGCFVPASSANISLCDRIFVRSGASDAITAGLSTFMVEMTETAYILNNATKNSLIVMDEIGRGTSTYDGISIAWAVAEFLITHDTSSKTLFATHYHELQALENTFPKRIKNYHMAVVEENGKPVFLHTLLPGGASASYGVAVAQLAGIPQSVINRAREILTRFETQNPVTVTNGKRNEQSLPSVGIAGVLSALNISTMTPLEALNKLAELQEKIKEHNM